MNKTSIFYLLLIGLMFTACGGEQTAADKTDDIEARREAARNKKTDPALVTAPEGTAERISSFESPLEGSSWKMTELNTSDLQHDFTAEDEASIKFSQGIVSGKGFCNQFNANYTVPNDGSVAVTNFRKSSQPCSGRPGAVERRAMTLIEEATAYTLQASTRLVLRKGDDSLTFLAN